MIDSITITIFVHFMIFHNFSCEFAGKFAKPRSKTCSRGHTIIDTKIEQPKYTGFKQAVYPIKH